MASGDTMAVDLHVHSTASDGTLSPTEIVREASARRLTAVSVVDHDTLAGVREALTASAGLPIEVIPGLEINTDVGPLDVHILGYHFEPGHEPLEQELARVREARVGRAGRIVARLNELGIGVTMDDVLAQAGDGAVARPHVAAALVALGVVGRVQEAFDRFLGRGRPAYVPRYRLTPAQAIAAIRNAGGVPVLGHPGLMGKDRLIRDLVAQGLEGLEAWHIDHTGFMVEKYQRLAAELGLVVTGGTDSHGPRGSRPIEIGQVSVPDSVLEPLRLRAEQVRRAAGLPSAGRAFP